MTPGLVIIRDYEDIYAVVDNTTVEIVTPLVREAAFAYQGAYISEIDLENQLRTDILTPLGLDPNDHITYGEFLAAFLKSKGLQYREYRVVYGGF